MEVNIHQAKTNLSRLIEQALRGEEVTIAKAGYPVVRLVPVQTAKPLLGSARGTVKMKKNWDAPLTDRELKKHLAG